MTASRGGDFDALLGLLDPDVVLRSDTAAVKMGSMKGVLGAAAVAGTFLRTGPGGKTRSRRRFAGAVWAEGGRARVVFGFTITDGKITAIDLLADSDRIEALELRVLEG